MITSLGIDEPPRTAHHRCSPTSTLKVTQGVHKEQRYLYTKRADVLVAVGASIQRILHETTKKC